MARPSKLTSEVSERIVRAIRAGNYPEVAAGHAGVHPATYYRWMERGALEGSAPEDDPIAAFAQGSSAPSPTPRRPRSGWS